MATRYNVPNYVKNVKSSMKNIARENFKTLMPNLSSTIVSSNDAFKEFKNFNKRTYSYGVYVTRQRHAIFAPLKNFIKNAKNDLKSGKFYNEDRLMKAQTGGIDDMLGSFDDLESDELGLSESDIEEVRITSKFDKYLKANMSGSISNDKMLSDSLNEVNINNTEYIANVNTINMTKLMTLTTKHHMEQMAQLKNIESIGSAIVSFNNDVVIKSIETRDKYLEDILNETRQLKESIDKQIEMTNARFKGSSSNGRPIDPLENILGASGSVDFKEYFKNIKSNVSKRIPISMDLIKMAGGQITSNPIGYLLTTALAGMIGNNTKNKFNNIDTSLSSLFAAYLLKMNKVKKSGTNYVGRMLADLLGVDMTNYNKPNLSIYQNQDITLQLEQRKAKAITEVIPTYLSEITRVMTGINKIYDYTRGIFVDKKSRRAELDKEIKNDIIGDMSSTRTAMSDNLYKINANKQQYKLLEADLDEFVYYLGITPEIYKPSMSYSYLKKRGLNLAGGEKSYNIIREIYKSMSKTDKMNINKEQVNSLGRRADMWRNFNENLQNSGNSAVYNQFNDDYSSTRRGPYGKGFPSYQPKNGGGPSVIHLSSDELSSLDIIDVQRALNTGMISEQEAKRRRDEIRNENKSDDEDDFDKLFSNIKNHAKKFSGRRRTNNKINNFLSNINSTLYEVLYGEDTTGEGMYGRVKKFGKNVWGSSKGLLFGDDKEDGLIPTKYQEIIKRYVPKSLKGAAAGSTIGLMFRNPILGASIGGAISILTETSKVKEFLWGNGKDTNGIFGGLKDKIDANVLGPIKQWVKDKFGNKYAKFVDNIRTSARKAFGKVDELFDTYDIPSSSSSSNTNNDSSTGTDFIDNLLSSTVNDMESGIYTNQLDTIIYLLSHNRLSGSALRQLSPMTYKRMSKNISMIESKNNSSQPYQSQPYARRSLPGQNIIALGPESYREVSSSQMSTTSTSLVPMPNSISSVSTEPEDIIATTVERSMLKDKTYRRHIEERIKNIKQTLKDKHANGTKFNIRSSFNGFNIDPSKLSSLKNNISGKSSGIFDGIGDKFKHKFRGIDKGRGSLMGMALGTMMLGNPILGAIMGASFSGKTDEQKEMDKLYGKPKYKTLSSALQYGAIAGLMGMNPMLGVLAGALFPRKAGDKNKPDSDKKGFPFKLGATAKGALIGSFFGPMGAMAGGLIGNRISHRKDKKAWMYDENGNKLSAEEIKEKKEQMRLEKRQKVAKGSFIDKFTGGGKLSGMALGGLMGALMISNPLLGATMGALGGLSAGTSRNKLNRNMTNGVLSKLGKGKAGLIGTAAINAMLLPMMGPLLAGIVAPMIGAPLGMMLAKKKDQRFWRYDEHGNLLDKDQIKANKAQFKYDYTHDENGNLLSRSEAREKKKQIMKEQNELRDKNEKDDKFSKFKNLKQFELFEVNKGKGAFKGAQFAAAAGVNPILGAMAGAVLSGKKRKTPPTGSPNDPYYVRIKDADPKSDEGKRTIKEHIEQKRLAEGEKRLALTSATTLAKDLKNDNQTLLKTGGESAENSIVKDLIGAKSPEQVDNVYKRAMFLGATREGDFTGSGLSGKAGAGADENKKNGILDALLGSLLGTKLGGLLKNIFNGTLISKLIGVGGATLALGNLGVGIKNVYDGVQDMRDQEYEDGSGELIRGSSQIVRGGISTANALNTGYRAAYYGTKLTKPQSFNPITRFGAKIGTGIAHGRATYFGNFTKNALANAGRTATMSEISMGKQVIKGSEKIIARTGENLGKTSTVVSRLTQTLLKVMDKIAEKFPQFGKLIAKHRTKIVTDIAKEAGEQAAKKGALSVLNKINFWLTIATVLYDFSSGMYETKNIMQTTSDFKVDELRLRFICGLSKALSNLLFGLIPYKWIAGFLYDLVGSEQGKANLANSQAAAKANYEEFMANNPGSKMTMADYQKVTNKTMWGKIASGLGFGKTLDKYVTNSDYKIPDYIKKNLTRDTFSAVNVTGTDLIDKGGANGISYFLSIIADNMVRITSSLGLISEETLKQYKEGAANSGYVIQDNSVTNNVTNNNMSGGRGLDSSSRNLILSKTTKSPTYSYNDNKDPEETLLNITNKKNIRSMLTSAVQHGANFLDDVKKNKNIKIVADKSKSITSKIKTGATIAKQFANSALNLGTKVKNNVEGAWDKVKSGASNIWSGLKSGASKVWSGIKSVGSKAWGGIKKAGNWVKGLFGGRGESVNDPDYYNQQDPRWADMSFGIYNNKRDTVGEGGCGPTTAATVLQKLTGRKITPAETSKFALNNGYKVNNGGTTPDYFNAVGSKYGVNFKQSAPVSGNTISNLRSGKPVIFLGHDSTGTSPFGNESHYVVGTGMDNRGNVSVLDPKNSANNRTYNINDLAANSMRAIVPSTTKRRYSGGRGMSRISNNRSFNKYSPYKIKPGRGQSTVKKYSVKKDGDKFLSKHFKVKDFMEKSFTNDEVLIDSELVEKLEKILSWTGGHMLITSGYRSPEYNSGTSWTGKTGPHTKGIAADISVDGYSVDTLASIADAVGFNGIAPYHKGGYVHVDTRASIVHAKTGDDEWANCSTSRGRYGKPPANKNSNTGSVTGCSGETHGEGNYSGPSGSSTTISQYTGTYGSGSTTINIISHKWNWNEEPAIRPTTDTIVIHHAESANNTTIEEIDNWHKSNGWSGVGYHYVVYRNGDIHQGRAENAVGAGVSDHNDHTIHVCAIGSYKDKNDMPSAQYNSMVNVCKYLKEIYPGAKVVGHRDIGDSDCPGKCFPLDKMISDIGNGGGVTAKNVTRLKETGGAGGASSGKKNLVNVLSGWMDSIGSAFAKLPSDKWLTTIASAWDGDTGSSDSNGTSSDSSNSSSTSSGSISHTGIKQNTLGLTNLTTSDALNIDPRHYTKISFDAFKKAAVGYAGNQWMTSDSVLKSFYDAANSVGIDPRWALAMGAAEAGWGGSEISRDKHNFYGIGAQDDDPYNKAYRYDNDEVGISEGLKWISKEYLDAGQNTFNAMKNPTSVGAPYWHSYLTGDITPRASIYAKLVNTSGGLGAHGGRGGKLFGRGSSMKPLAKYPNLVKNPFTGVQTRGPSDLFGDDTDPTINKFREFENENIKSFTTNIAGGRGGTIAPIPSTSSVIEALSNKSYASTVSKIDEITKTINKPSNNTPTTSGSTNNITVNTSNATELAMLEVLKSIASTLDRIERNNAMIARTNRGGSMHTTINAADAPNNTYKNDIISSIATGR